MLGGRYLMRPISCITQAPVTTAMSLISTASRHAHTTPGKTTRIRNSNIPTSDGLIAQPYTGFSLHANPFSVTL